MDNLIEPVELVGGTIRVLSQPGHGTCLGTCLEVILTGADHEQGTRAAG